jgi:hypothetical protein
MVRFKRDFGSLPRLLKLFQGFGVFLGLKFATLKVLNLGK